MRQSDLRFSEVEAAVVGGDARADSTARAITRLPAGQPSSAQPLSVRVKEACRLTGIGRSKLYELIAAGELEVVKVGTITLVPMDSLQVFLDRCRAR